MAIVGPPGRANDLGSCSRAKTHQTVDSRFYELLKNTTPDQRYGFFRYKVLKGTKVLKAPLFYLGPRLGFSRGVINLF